MQTKRETEYVPASLPLQSISLKTPTEALGKFLSGARIPKHHIRCPSQEDAKPGQVEEILPALALLARLARNQRKRAKAEEGEPSSLQAFQESGAGNGTRTRGTQLGRLALYHLSYSPWKKGISVSWRLWQVWRSL
jgi:hypothetical protein